MLFFQAEAKKAEQRDSSRMGQGGNMGMGGAQMNSGYNRGQFGYPQMPGKDLFYGNFCLIVLHFLRPNNANNTSFALLRNHSNCQLKISAQVI